MYTGLYRIYGIALKVRPQDLKYWVHVIKFYSNWLEFDADDSMQQAATSRQLTLSYQNMGPTSKPDPKNKSPCCHLKILKKLTRIR